MHIMPSDANCITTTNIVNTDSIYYEKRFNYLMVELDLEKIKDDIQKVYIF